MVGGVRFTTSSTLSLSKLSEIAAFRGGFPFLVRLVRVLVRDIWGFSPAHWVVVMVVLRVRLGVALVVMVVVVVVTIQTLISTP